MSPPIKILILYPEDKSLLLKPLEIKEHLQISLSRLSNTKTTIEVIPLDNIQKNQLSDTDKIVLLHTQNFNPNEFLKAFNSEEIKKCILVLPDEDIQPLSIQYEIKHYNFFDIDPETGAKRAYRAEEATTSILYWSGILDIAFDILSDLKKLNRNESVYVAETTPELYQYRNAVCSELAHRGFNILPRQLFNGNTDEITAAIEKYLDISIMSVHLIGSRYGKPLSGSENSLVELQCRLAAKKWRLSSQQADKKQFNRIIWFPPGIKAADEKQQHFFDTLRIEDKNNASEIIQVPLEDLKATLRVKIEEIVNEVVNKNENKTSIYLIHEPKDSSNIKELTEYFNIKGVEVLSIDTIADSENIVSTHLNFLTQASAALIIDNDCSPTWVKSKIKDLIKAPGYGRLKAFSAKAISTKSPSKYQNLAENNGILIINSSIVKEEAYQQFLKKLNLVQ